MTLTQAQFSELPLSQKLRFAVLDAVLCEMEPELYVLDMSDFHVADDKCHVCMAGAVIVQTLGVSPLAPKSVASEYFSESARSLWAIDSLRRGHIFDAMSQMKLTTTVDVYDLQRKWTTTYRATDRLNGRLDWDEYLEMADDLQEVGL